MKGRQIVFIVLLTVAAMLVWIIGEALIIAAFRLGGKASVIWTVFMVAVTIVISLWRGLKDESKKNSRKW